MMSLLNAAKLITDSLRLNGSPPPFEGEIDWDQLVYHADGHGLTPLLYDTWRAAGRLNQLPAEIKRRMAKAYRDNRLRNTRTRQDVIDAHRILSQAEVPHIALKGWSLIERLYSDPAHRFLTDHDFLTPPDRAAIGHQALREAGYRPLPQKDEWIEKHLPSLWRNNGYQWDGYLFDPNYPRPVELHLTLWEEGWRGLQVRQLSDLWPTAQQRTVVGSPMLVLSNENTLIHLAVHFAGHLVEGDPRLNQLLDLARFMAQEVDHLNWHRIVGQAQQVNISRFVCVSLWLANQIFDAPLPPDDPWRQIIRLTPGALRRWLPKQGIADTLTADYRRKEKGKDYQMTFLAAQSLIEQLGIVRFAMLPPLGHLMAKYHFQHRWQGVYFYPRYIVERMGQYGQAMRQRQKRTVNGQ